MDIKQPMNEYLRLAKIKEIEEKLDMYGYDVAIEAQSGQFTFDIIAEKTYRKKSGEQSIERKFIVVKTGHYSPEKIAEISVMRHYVENTIEGEFELVIAHPPRKKDIGFYQFEDAFGEYVISVFKGEETSDNDDFKEYLEYLRTRSEDTLIESVSDIDIDILDVRDDEIFVSGVATINIVLQFNDLDMGEVKLVDSYSCSYEATVYDVFNYGGVTIDIEEFKLDVPEEPDDE